MSLVGHKYLPVSPAAPRMDAAEYPLQERFFLLGVIAGAVGGIAFQTWAGAALFASPFWATGMTWRRNDPPVLPFCLAYQWLFVAAPYFAWALGIETRQAGQRVDPTQAVLLAAAGFIVLAAGIRCAWWLLGASMKKASARLGEDDNRLSIPRLFWVVIAAYAISWLYYIQPMQVSYVLSQFVYAALAIRLALLVLLWQLILRQQRGYRYGLVALAVVVVPMLASKMSAFKVLFFLIFVLLLWELRPGSVIFRSARQRRLAWGAVILTASLVLVGVVWEGAVKPAWRTAEVSGQTFSRVQRFMSLSSAAVEVMDWGVSAGSLLDRISSVDQFARVLRRVPSQLPFEQGDMTMNAVRHVFLPRFLFPDKPSLDSSRITRHYAGIEIGAGTSIGIGYMAEFYIDFGVPGMYVALLFYGGLIGLLYAMLVLGVPARLSAPLLMVLFVDGFDGFESDLAKQIGGLLLKAFCFLAMAVALGGPLARFLYLAAPLQRATVSAAPPLR